VDARVTTMSDDSPTSSNRTRPRLQRLLQDDGAALVKPDWIRSEDSGR
jgi:hypothetical protein